MQASSNTVTWRVGACITGVPQRVIGSTVPPHRSSTAHASDSFSSLADVGSRRGPAPRRSGVGSASSRPRAGRWQRAETSNTRDRVAALVGDPQQPAVQRDVPRPGAAAVELGHRRQRCSAGSRSKTADGVHTPVRHVDPGAVGGDAGWLDESAPGSRCGSPCASRQPSPSRAPSHSSPLSSQATTRWSSTTTRCRGPEPAGSRIGSPVGHQWPLAVEPQPVDLVAAEVAGQHLVADDHRLVGVRALLALRDRAAAGELQGVDDSDSVPLAAIGEHRQQTGAVAGDDRVTAVRRSPRRGRRRRRPSRRWTAG